MHESSENHKSGPVLEANRINSSDLKRVVDGPHSHGENKTLQQSPFNDSHTEKAWLEILGLNA